MTKFSISDTEYDIGSVYSGNTVKKTNPRRLKFSQVMEKYHKTEFAITKYDRFNEVRKYLNINKKKTHLKALNSIDFGSPKQLDPLAEIPNMINNYEDWLPTVCDKVKNKYYEMEQASNSKKENYFSNIKKWEENPNFDKLVIHSGTFYNSEVSELITNRFEHELTKVQSNKYNQDLEQRADKDYFRKYLNVKLRGEKIHDIKNDLQKNLNKGINKFILSIKRGHDFTGFEGKMKILWSGIHEHKNMPFSREGASVVVHPNNDNLLYLFGGKGHMLFNSMHMFNFKEQKWSDVKYAESRNYFNETPRPRYGHSTVALNNEIYIYGGANKYQSAMQKRMLFNDIFRFNLSSLRWTKLNMCPLRRRLQSVTMAFNRIVFNGGLDEFDCIRGETFLYNISTDFWQTLDSQIKVNLKPPTAMHSSSFVCTADILRDPTQDIQNHPEHLFYNDRKYSIGVYYFGGLVESTDHVGQVSTNKLYIMKTGQPLLSVSEIKAKNYMQGPTPRFYHSMVYDEISHYLIITGGRANHESNLAFGDTWMFSIMELNWVKVRDFGSKPSPRYGHLCALRGQELLIFGGMYDNQYLNLNFHFGDFNQTRCRNSVGNIDINDEVKMMAINLKQNANLNYFD